MFHDIIKKFTDDLGMMKNQGNNSRMIEQDPLVLVVDDDPDFCNMMQQMISHLGIRVESTSNPLQVLDIVRGGIYNVILLDIRMPEKSGMDLLSEIVETSPDTKIIIVSAFGDKGSLIRALRLGAFDFLEKPFEYKLLSHSIKRALETQRVELAYKDERMKLRDANRMLAENNKALSILSKNIERAQKDTQTNIEKKIRISILPIIERLQQRAELSQYCQRDLRLLMDLVTNLTSILNGEQELFKTLTPTEFRIALLIKNRLTTNEIAEHIHISPETVKSHRGNIRKKLNLNKSHHNLRAHLQTTLDQ